MPLGEFVYGYFMPTVNLMGVGAARSVINNPHLNSSTMLPIYLFPPGRGKHQVR